jgi:hypothetical protein
MARSDLGRIFDEVEEEPEVLVEFAKRTLPRAPPGSVFVGAGDSYAVALSGFYGSGGRCMAIDPYALAADPRLAEGREAFFVSVSGKTASNLAAARSVARFASGTTSITAVADSPLAESTGRTVLLPMVYAPRSPGFLSFSLSLLAVLKIGQGDLACDFGQALDTARRDFGEVSFGKGTTYFLGNSLAYPAALYAAAKTYEMLGTKAHAELLEEFSHLELFSLAKRDAVNAFSAFDPSSLARMLNKNLAKRGYVSSIVAHWGASALEKLFHAVFVAQLSVLEASKRAGLSRPRFLDAEERLSASDAMIY